MDGLRSDGRIRKAEYRPGNLARQRQKIVRPSKADQPAHACRLDTCSAQVRRIQRQHCRVVRTGRMAHEKNLLRIATYATYTGDMVEHPTHGLCAIREKIGVTYLGIQAIVRQHRDVTPGRQRLTGKQIVRAFAAIPVAAVKEHHHWRLCSLAGRLIDIKHVARVSAVADACRRAVVAGRRPAVDQG